MTYNIKLGLTYENTDFNREMIITDVSETDAAIETVRAKVQTLNDSIANDADLRNFFRSDDFDAEHAIGTLRGISSCEVKAVDSTQIL